MAYGQTSDEAFGKGIWHHEIVDNGLYSSLKITKSIFEGESPFQKIQFFETECYGQALYLDNTIQSTAEDEHIYHESLVHPALCMHQQPKKIFIGGGGEGGTLREILKHKVVEQVVMVDIDEKVVELCKQHMPTLSQGAFDDPRLTLIIDDAKAVLEKQEPESFDIIVLDLADPFDDGPCHQLYTDSFYQMCKTKLKKNGILVTQSGLAGELDIKDGVILPIYSTLKTVFSKVQAYVTMVPSFNEDWSYVIAYNDKDIDFEACVRNIDNKLKIDNLDSRLKWYDQQIHNRMFSLSKNIRQCLQNETRIISVDNPLFTWDPRNKVLTEQEQRQLQLKK